MPPTDQDMRDPGYVPASVDDAVRTIVLRLLDMHEQKNGTRPAIMDGELPYMAAVRLMPVRRDWEQQVGASKKAFASLQEMTEKRDARSLDLDRRQLAVQRKEDALLGLRAQMAQAVGGLTALIEALDGANV